ncbi:beta-N-acetylhexosaminidase [Sulfitobacter sp. D35]|uniref:beta-N-acetylhexosaminidase n=1 Tax=Sulfitobacter sp. D35 TaxID=3083252 RepID=UPI00296FE75E|nr:beta-N-acetylhexosaminidase [Sulfitobacter sp. D35]MDW4497578.1 beta-N-acetylhexosaminidase [Sulfitobacter sp. D35]
MTATAGARTFGATILDAEGLRLTPHEKSFFREADPFGFILFARNVDTPDQLRALCDEMRAAVGRDAPITVDQEGGRVQRLRAPHWSDWTPPLDFAAAAGDVAEKAMYLRYRIIAHELRVVGIDSDCAPMLDVATDATHAFLRNRCYAGDPDTVARLGQAVAEGLLAGGVLPVMKHMPGHGRATLDSHHDLPRVTAARDDLEAVDFAPFRALADLPMGMTGHLVFEALDDAPATQSPRLINLIRDEIGFDGLLMTDDLSMNALSGSYGARARAALDAGCDVALLCNRSLAERQEATEAAGRMTAAAQARAERALAARRAPDDIDIAAARAQLETLLSGRDDG